MYIFSCLLVTSILRFFSVASQRRSTTSRLAPNVVDAHPEVGDRDAARHVLHAQMSQLRVERPLRVDEGHEPVEPADYPLGVGAELGRAHVVDVDATKQQFRVLVQLEDPATANGIYTANGFNQHYIMQSFGLLRKCILVGFKCFMKPTPDGRATNVRTDLRRT